jgi:hypothetical protein
METNLVENSHILRSYNHRDIIKAQEEYHRDCWLKNNHHIEKKITQRAGVKALQCI